MPERIDAARRGLLKGAGLAAVGAVAGSLVPTMEAAAAGEEAPRWVMIMDLRRCTGCRACVVACKAEYDVPLGVWNTVIQDEVAGKFPEVKKVFIPRTCNHCEGKVEEKIPPCVKSCPEYPKDRRVFITPEGKKIRYRGGATFKRPDGLVLYDNRFCTGCGKCIEACPYGARAFNSRLISGKDSTKHGITKCLNCEHRIAGGVEPACVNICPGKARIFGNLNDPDSKVTKLAKEFALLDNSKTVLLPNENTRPMVFYIDPYGILEKGVLVRKKYEKMEVFKDIFSETQV